MLEIRKYSESENMDGSCSFSQQIMCHAKPRGTAEYVRVIQMARSGTDLLLAGATPCKRYKIGRTL